MKKAGLSALLHTPYSRISRITKDAKDPCCNSSYRACSYAQVLLRLVLLYGCFRAYLSRIKPVRALIERKHLPNTFPTRLSKYQCILILHQICSSTQSQGMHSLRVQSSRRERNHLAWNAIITPGTQSSRLERNHHAWNAIITPGTQSSRLERNHLDLLMLRRYRY
jgi:hypothetical protein